MKRYFLKIAIMILIQVLIIGCLNTHAEHNTISSSTSKLDTLKKEIDCSVCNVAYVTKIKVNIDNISEKQVVDFLSCFNERCITNNAEFLEYSNEILFLLFTKRTDLMIQILTKRNWLLKGIKKELENPIDDTIDLKGIYQKIKEAKGNSIVKDSLLKSLKVALDKYNK